MTKFKGGLVKGYMKQVKEEKEQAELRKKHHVPENDNRIIVEKKSAIKYLVIATGRVIQILATILILLLAIVGATALAYPQIRQEIFSILFVGFM